MLGRKGEFVRLGRKIDGCVHSPARARDDISAIPQVDAITTLAGAPRLQPLSGESKDHAQRLDQDHVDGMSSAADLAAVKIALSDLHRRKHPGRGPTGVSLEQTNAARAAVSRWHIACRRSGAVTISYGCTSIGLLSGSARRPMRRSEREWANSLGQYVSIVSLSRRRYLGWNPCASVSSIQTPPAR